VRPFARGVITREVRSSIPMMRPTTAVRIAGAVAALAIALWIYVVRLDRVVGLIVDDAWYVLLAKALATGRGYTLINSPTPGITPFYPPGFPALLSIVFRLAPNFPDNVWLLKSVSVAAMIAAGPISFRYFEHHRGLPASVAFPLACATAIYPALVFLATSSVMSECVFASTQLAAIALLEGSVRRGGSGAVASSAGWRVAAGGALASFAFLTRAGGLGLLLAGLLYLFKERRLRHAWVFASVAAVLVAPWTLQVRSHAPTPEERAEQGGSIVLPYTTQFWERTAGRPQSGTLAISDLPGRVLGNLTEIGKDDFGALVFYSLYRPIEPGESMRISDEATWVSIAFALLALAGFAATVRERVTLAEIVVPVELGISALWGWEQYRLLLPLVPFLFFYLLRGVAWMAGRLRRLSARRDPRGASGEVAVLLAISWSFVGSGLYANYQYIQRKYDPVPEHRTRWIEAFRENESFLGYIGQNVPKDELLATDNPALVNLYTGHKTIASMNPAARWEVWRHLGVRYLAEVSPYPLEHSEAPSQYPTIHRSDGFVGLRLIDLGPPSSRPPWPRE